MSAREEKIVLDFIGQFRESWPADLDKTMEALADDCYYQVVVPTIAAVHGRANVLAEIRLMQARGCEDQKHDMISVGSGGNKVFTERVDHSKRNGQWTKVPLVAVWEVNAEGKISAWREYLDLVNVAQGHGMDAGELVKSLDLEGAHA